MDVINSCSDLFFVRFDSFKRVRWRLIFHFLSQSGLRHDDLKSLFKRTSTSINQHYQQISGDRDKSAEAGGGGKRLRQKAAI